MFRLTMLAVCLCAAQAYRVDYDYELENMDELFERGMPASPASKEGGSECKKDILILWDNSWSVGATGFKNNVRPFIKKLVSSPRLNVGPDGTHIGIITFSTQAKTRVLKDIGEIQTKEDWLTWLDSLQYSDVSGDGTRTGMALKMADEKFAQTSPNNYRPDVGDVVIIFTDGQPVKRKFEDPFESYEGQYKGNKGETRLATDRATSLKAKDVTVVGLAVGDASAKFEEDIRGWATNDKYYFRANMKALPSILNNLISASCIDPGQCLCDTVTGETYTAQGEKAMMSWVEPSLKCASNRPAIVDSKDVRPQISSPAEFGVGFHTITYTYGYRRGSKIAYQKCFVEIDVKACQCPRNGRVIALLPSGKRMASVSWQVPKPSCPARLTSALPRGAINGHGTFPIGQHTVVYNYEHSGPTGSFSLSCPLIVNIKGKLCGGVGFGPSQVCCCGTVYDRKLGFQCCGSRYYNTALKRCEDYYTLVDL